jgi:hypothetical protein
VIPTTTLNETGRKRILDMVGKELTILLGKANDLASQHWDAAEVELKEELGMQDDLIRADQLRDQIVAAQRELEEIEHRHEWRAKEPMAVDYQDAGFLDVQADSMGRVRGYGAKPAVFNRSITSKWDLEVFKRLDARMQLRKVDFTLHQVAHAVEREVALAGTYEKARESYNQFYQLLRRAGGEEMPPLLAEIVDMPALLPPGAEPPETGASQ